jgi:hypothetical protein
VASGGERFADEDDNGYELAGDQHCWDAEHELAGGLTDAGRPARHRACAPSAMSGQLPVSGGRRRPRKVNL